MCWLRKICVSVLLLSLMALGVPPRALAQDPVTVHYASASGVSLSYPIGWLLSDQLGMIAITNDLSAISVGVLSPDSVGFVVFDPVAVNRLLGGNTPTPSNVSSAVITLLGSGQLEWELLDSDEIRIASRSAIRVGARSDQADGLLLIMDFGEDKTMVMAAMTSAGEMGQFEEMLLAIAASIDYESAWRIIVEAHRDYIKAVAFSPDGARIASASNDHTVRVWDVATGAEVFTLLHDNWVQAASFSPDGTLIASGSIQGFGGSVRLWDAVTGEPVAELVRSGYVNSVAFSPDGALIASSADNESLVYLWSFDGTWQEQGVLSGHTDGIQAVAFSADGAWLASASIDHTVRVWDVATEAEALILQHPDSVNSVAFSPDSTLIVTGGEDGIVRLWDAATGDLVAELNGHLGAVTDVVFSPDGARIASSSHDKSVRLWVLDGAWQAEAIFKGHTDWVRSVAFSPDGTLVGSGADDGQVIVWDVARR